MKEVILSVLICRGLEDTLTQIMHGLAEYMMERNINSLARVRISETVCCLGTLIHKWRKED